jgi:hypothetical protein
MFKQGFLSLNHLEKYVTRAFPSIKRIHLLCMHIVMAAVIIIPISVIAADGKEFSIWPDQFIPLAIKQPYYQNHEFVRSYLPTSSIDSTDNFYSNIVIPLWKNIIGLSYFHFGIDTFPYAASSLFQAKMSNHGEFLIIVNWRW